MTITDIYSKRRKPTTTGALRYDELRRPEAAGRPDEGLGAITVVVPMPGPSRCMVPLTGAARRKAQHRKPAEILKKYRNEADFARG